MLRLLRRRQVLDRVGCSAPTLARWVRSGLFPAPIRPNFAGHCSRSTMSAWVESEVDQWIADRIAAHRGVRPEGAPANAEVAAA
jgi:predicted DNA-binding transcriptional regulator AlpA